MSRHRVSVGILTSSVLALSAVLGLNTGHATVARAASARTMATRSGPAADPQLDVSVKPGSVTVIPLVSVHLTVTYTCARTASPDAEISVVLEENGTTAASSVTEPCGAADVNQDAGVTVLFPLVAADTEITSNVTLFDGKRSISSSADLVRHSIIGHFDPGFTFNSDGSVTLTGSYVCDVVDPDMWLGITLGQGFPAAGTREMGTAIVPVTCDGAVHAFSTTITGTAQGTGVPAARRAPASDDEEALATGEFEDHETYGGPFGADD